MDPEKLTLFNIKEPHIPPSVQFSSVTQSCPTLCDALDCSMPGFSVHHQLPELTQTHVPRVRDAIQPSVIAFFCLQSFPASGSFPMSQFFTSDGQSIGVSALASVLPVNIPDCFPLDILVWSLCSPRDSQESSPSPQFKSSNSSALCFVYSLFHIHTWLLEKYEILFCV